MSHNIKDIVRLFDLKTTELHPSIEQQALQSGHYPYDKLMRRKIYEQQLMELQIELLKLQSSIAKRGERIVILFEGRDAAGKGGNIKRFSQHLNPRHAHVIALSKPTEAERGQWYFQRYISHLPTAGDMALFDRSWYNRAGVEPVMGFCTAEQHQKFLQEVPAFEKGLVRDGIHLFKFWLTIGQAMQLRRLHRRHQDPLKRWKISPIDLKAIHKWDDYTKAKEEMFSATHKKETPWTVIRANDKRRARLGAMRYVLNKLSYQGKDNQVIGRPDPKIIGSGKRFFFDS